MMHCNQANRTCPIYVGVGHHPVGTPVANASFVRVDYAWNVPLNVTTWLNTTVSCCRSRRRRTWASGASVAVTALDMRPSQEVYPSHPLMKGVLWIDEYSQPSFDMCYLEILQQLNGNLTAANMATYLAPLAQTGGLHTVAMDFQRQQLWIANAAFPLTHAEMNSSDAAFNRQFVRIDLAPLFAQPPPSIVSEGVATIE
jgi:hypothetical protein